MMPIAIFNGDIDACNEWLDYAGYCFELLDKISECCSQCFYPDNGVVIKCTKLSFINFIYIAVC